MPGLIYSLPPLTNGNTYYYSAFFYNSGHSYLPRINVEATPNEGGGFLGAPTNLQVLPGLGSLLLTWKDNSDPEVGFSIERKIEDGSWPCLPHEEERWVWVLPRKLRSPRKRAFRSLYGARNDRFNFGRDKSSPRKTPVILSHGCEGSRIKE